MTEDPPRCAWAGADPAMRAYHDTEWGVPQRDGRALWEILTLEGFQAGLSWITVLRKRDAFRRAFAGFDPAAVAAFGEADVARLVADPGIIRSRAKIEATIAGARALPAPCRRAARTSAAFVWSFVDGTPIEGDGRHVPTETPTSVAMAKALKRRGFKFVGPSITYAFMQASGLVNDHAEHCFRRRTVGAARE